MTTTETVQRVRIAQKTAPLASAIAIILLTAACSAGPQSDSDPAAVGVANPVSPPPGAAPPEAASSAGGDAGTAGSRSACQVLGANLLLLEQAATSGGDPGLADSIARMRRLETSAPADVRPAITVIADFDQRVLDTVSAGGSPAGIGETPELSAAARTVATWLSNNCR